MADIQLRFKIADAKVATAKAAFLRVKPNITNNPDFPGDPVPDNEWIRREIKRMVNDVINAGNAMLDREQSYTPPVADEFMEDDE